MTGSQLDIDAIVREVLRRLDESLSRGQARAGRGMAPAEPRDADCLRVDERVVTVATLDGRLGAVKRVSVPSGAVVTPAARDLLRESGVALASADTSLAPRQAAGQLLVGLGTGDAPRPAVVSAVTDEVEDAEIIHESCPVAVTRQLLDRIASDGDRAILLIPEPIAALCAANRREGVRAAWGVSVAAVSQAVMTLKANLLIIDPGSHSLYEVRSMVRQFIRGPREFSARWKQLVE